MNPRDTADNLKRHQIIRRGGTYGALLPEGAPDDGADRGIAAFNGCGSLVRQFEFAMNVWANDPSFHGLKNERDPFALARTTERTTWRFRNGRSGKDRRHPVRDDQSRRVSLSARYRRIALSRARRPRETF
jgi:hypothetical protein